MPLNSINRRTMLQTSLLAAGGAAAIENTSPVSAANANSNIKLEPGSVILFQGDSITDARRSRKIENHPNHSQALGFGYPLLTASQLLESHAELGLKIYNRGISGNKVPDLKNRWQKDCLDLKPAILSILIGVNDIWHKLNGRYDGSVKDYETGFAELLQQTQKALPETKIVICEPFVLKCGAVNEKWFPEFDERRAAAKKVASDAGTLWVPFQTMFDDAVKAGTKPVYWAGDGVHPSLAGHALMAKTWRKIVGI